MIFKSFFGTQSVYCLVSFPKNRSRKLRLELVPPKVGWRSFDTGFTKWNEVKIPTEKCIFFGLPSLHLAPLSKGTSYLFHSVVDKQRNEQNKSYITTPAAGRQSEVICCLVALIFEIASCHFDTLSDHSQRRYIRAI